MSLSIVKKMAETQKLLENGVGEVIGKQENDRSFNQGVTGESGVEDGSMVSERQISNDRLDTGASSSGYDSLQNSSKSTWEEFEDEVVNPLTFKLNIMQSSNVERCLDDCEISSIEHAEGTQKLRKG